MGWSCVTNGLKFITSSGHLANVTPPIFRFDLRLFKKSSKSGKKEVTSGNFPLASVIYADNQFAVYEDLKAFKAVSDEGGLSLDCIKLALKVFFLELFSNEFRLMH